MPRPDARDTREEIKDVARDLFGTQGFSKTSLREIAGRMEFTKAALYHHFATKDALLAELLEPLFTAHDALLDELSGPLDNPEARTAFLSGYLGITLDHSRVAQIFAGDPGVFTHPDVGPAVRKLVERQIEVIAGDSSDESRLRATATLHVMASALNPTPASRSTIHSTLLGAALAILESSPVT